MDFAQKCSIIWVSIIFLHVFVNVVVGWEVAKEIPVADVLELIKCHINFRYSRKVHPEPYIKKEKNPEPNRKEEKETRFMQEYMDKFFEMETFIKGCVNNPGKHHKMSERYNELEIALLSPVHSWFGRWLTAAKEELQEKFKEIDKKQLMNKDGEPIMDKKGNPTKMAFKHWRRMLMPHGLLMEAYHLKFAITLFDKFIKNFEQMPNFVSGNKRNSTVHDRRRFNRKKEQQIKHKKELLKNFKWISARLGDQLKNNWLNAKYSFVKEYIEKKGVPDLAEIEYLISGERISMDNLDNMPKLEWPKVKRVIWLIRHAQRFDHVHKSDTGKPLFYEVDGRNFALDNSPLSKDGKEMTKKIRPLIAAIPVKYFYASPYERTVDTAHLILGESHPNVQIRLEPGLIESLHRRKTEKPTYQKPEELINLGKYQRIDEKYKPRYDADKLEKYAKKEEVGDEDDACVKRVGEVFGLILQKDSDFESGISGHHSGPEKAKEINKLENIPGKTVPEEGKKIPQEIVEKLKDELLAPGEENADHIVIVTHASLMLSVQQYFDGKFQYVPQLSVTKLVELDEGHNEFDEVHKMRQEEGETSITRKAVTSSLENPLLRNIRLFYGSDTKYVIEFTQPNNMEELFAN